MHEKLSCFAMHNKSGTLCLHEHHVSKCSQSKYHATPLTFDNCFIRYSNEDVVVNRRRCWDRNDNGDRCEFRFRKSALMQEQLVQQPLKEVQIRKRMRIMVAIDESDGSFYALKWALDHLVDGITPTNVPSQEESSLITLVHVQALPAPHHPCWSRRSRFKIPYTRSLCLMSTVICKLIMIW